MTIHVRKQVEFSAYEKSYLPEVTRGLVVTLSHFFGNLFGSRKTRALQTIRYPEERRVYPPRYRGQHRLLARENGKPRCVACYMCATACPAYCIRIVAKESDDPQIEKCPEVFEIDTLRCIYCGFCVEACPEDAIRMDTGIHSSPTLDRTNAVLNLNQLMGFSGAPNTKAPYGAQNTRERSAQHA